MRILVTGKNGQLGKSISRVVKRKSTSSKFIFTGRNELDFADKRSIDNFFKNNKFDIIINCAAFTSVDKAEKEPILANKINNIAVKKIAKIAKIHNSKLIHISTDYVFNGKKNKPYNENSKTNPINIYGKTKLAGENSLIKLMKNNAIIIRTSWVYSEFGNNFLKTMLNLVKQKKELSIVDDQNGAPTYANDLALAIVNIIIKKSFTKKKFATKIYHFSNRGRTTWFNFAKEIFRISNIQCKIKPVTTKKNLMTAKRPKNSCLNIDKIHKSFKIRNYKWQHSLKQCIKNIFSNEAKY